MASEMIRDAVSATRWNWPDTPVIGIITFVDKSKVKAKEHVGRCYLEAGFKHIGFTKGGLWAFQMEPCDMPPPECPIGATEKLCMAGD